MHLVDNISSLSTINIPEQMWDDESLTPTDIKLFYFLLKYSKDVLEKNEEGTIDPSGQPWLDIPQKILAKHVGVSTPTIQTSLKRLKEAKYIHIVGQSNTDMWQKKPNTMKVLSANFTFKPKLELVVDNTTTREETKKPRRGGLRMEDIERYKEILQQYKESNQLSASDRITMKSVKRYQFCVRKLMGYQSYNAVSVKNPTEHANWKYFKKLEKMCEEKGWPVDLYLEAQFDRASNYWQKLPQKFPLAKQLCAEKAQDYFIKWRANEREKRAENVYSTGIKAREVKTYKQEIMEGVVNSVQLLKNMKTAEDKYLFILVNWSDFHPAYLWSIEGFNEGGFFDYLCDIHEGKSLEKQLKGIQAMFDKIDRSKALQELVTRAVDSAEKALNLPRNLAISEIEKMA